MTYLSLYVLSGRCLSNLRLSPGPQNKLSKPYETPLYNFTPPARRPLSEYNFTEVSYVLSHPTPVCFPNAACEKMPNDPVCKVSGTELAFLSLVLLSGAAVKFWKKYSNSLSATSFQPCVRLV